MKEYYRRNLPHYHPIHANYFITFRLVNSLPRWIIERLKEEYTLAIESQEKEKTRFAKSIIRMKLKNDIVGTLKNSTASSMNNHLVTGG